MNDGNRIWAPVSPDDVSEVLAVNSYDVGTLCRSDRINPGSLIRPAYVTSPSIGPESFPTGLAGPHPGHGIDFLYTLKRWGYYVPNIGTPADIMSIADTPWLRNKPAGDSFDCLTHFDGYQHNATPHLPVSATVVAGKPIVLDIFPGNAQTVLSADGMANPGGVVALYEVLGAVRVGCTVFTNGTYPKHFISSETIGNADQPRIVIETDIVAQPGVKYTVVPWVTDGNMIGNKIVANSRFYSIKYYDEFESVIEMTVPQTLVYFSKVTVQKEAARVSFSVNVSNQFTTAQTLYNFRLVVSYLDVSGMVVDKTLNLTGSTALSVPAKSGAEGTASISLYTTDNDLLVNYSRLRSMQLRASWQGHGADDDVVSPQLAGSGTGGGVGVEVPE